MSEKANVRSVPMAENTDPPWVDLAPAFIGRRLRGRRLLVTLIGSFGWLSADKIVRMGLGLATTILVSRYLGPRGFGELNYGIAFTALFAALGTMGVQAVVGRELIRRPDARRMILASALVLRLGGTSLAMALSVGLILHIEAGGTDGRAVVIAQALAMLPLAWEVVDYDYNSAMKPGPVVIVRSAACLVISVAKLALVAAAFPLVAFAWTAFGEHALAALALVVLSKRQGRAFSVREATFGEVRSLAKEAFPLLLSGLSIMVYMRIDQVMLRNLANASEAGIFSVAVRVSEVWYFIPVVAVTAVAPALTGAYLANPVRYQTLLLKLMSALTWAATSVAVGMTFLADPLVKLLFGREFAHSAAVLSVHIWAGVFVALGVSAGPWLVNSGLQRFQVVQTLVGALANIALNLAVIPTHGALGASGVTVVSYCLSGVLVNAAFPQTRELFAMQLRSLDPRRMFGVSRVR